MENSREVAQVKLANVFAFTEDDLQLNRQGRISDRQVDAMQVKHRGNCRFALSLFVIIMGLGFLGFCGAMIQAGSMSWESVGYFVTATGIIASFIAIFFVYYRVQLNRTVAAGIAYRTEGPIRILMERGEKTFVRYFCVGQQKVRIEKHQDYLWLKNSGLNGCEAVLYYSHPWFDLLSVELTGH